MLKVRLHLANCSVKNSQLAEWYFEISFKAAHVMLHRFAYRILLLTGDVLKIFGCFFQRIRLDITLAVVFNIPHARETWYVR